MTETADIICDPSAVATLERSRLLTSGGGQIAEFTDTSNPTVTTVADLIDQAAQLLLIQLPPEFDCAYYSQAQGLVALLAAILLEGSVFREQLDQGAVSLWRSLLTDGLAALQGALGWSPGEGDGTGALGGASAHSIGSVRARPVLADYDPLYDLYRELPML